MTRTLSALLLLTASVALPGSSACAAVADPDQWAGSVVQALSHGHVDALERVLQEALPEPPSADPVQGRKQLTALMKQLRLKVKRGELSAGEQLDAQRIGSVFRRYAFAAHTDDGQVLFRIDMDNTSGKWSIFDFYAGTDLHYVMRGDLPGSQSYKRHR